jgi:hypothetical protein
METTHQGRQRIKSEDFARILDWLFVLAPNGSEAEALAGVRRFVGTSLCSRAHVRNFSDSEVNTFVASNTQYLDNIIRGALRRVHDLKLRDRKKPASWNERIAAQHQMLDRLTQEGIYVHLAAADAKIATDVDNPAAVSEPARVGTVIPAVSWTPLQSMSGIHAKRSIPSVQ